MESRSLGATGRMVSVVGLCLPRSPALVRQLVPRALELGCTFFVALSPETREACGNHPGTTLLYDYPGVLLLRPGDAPPFAPSRVVMAPYNLLDHTFARDHFSAWRKEKRGIVAVNVLLGGALRQGSSDPRVRSFERLAKPGRSLIQAAIQFVVANEAVSSAVVRCSTLVHLEEVLGASEAPPLTAQELEQTFELYANRFE